MAPDKDSTAFLSHQAAREVLARAAVLDAAHGDSVSLASLRDAAQEAGIGVDALDRAFDEVVERSANRERAPLRVRRNLFGVVDRAGAMVFFAVVGACSETRKEVSSTPVVAREALRAEAVGCWQLFGQWGASPPDAYWAPAYVQLDTVPAGTVHGVGVRLSHRFDEHWAALPLNLEPGINGLNTWRADRDSDSIRIVFNNMFSGSEFVMLLRSGAARNDTMRGRHSQFSDDMRDPVRSLGTAHAVRADCGRRFGAIRGVDAGSAVRFAADIR